MQFEIVYSLLECFISGAGRCFLVVLYELANGLKSEEMYVSSRELITDSISMREVISSLYVTLARPIVFLHLTALSAYQSWQEASTSETAFSLSSSNDYN